MTDSLRTRIAAVLMNEPGVLIGEAAATQLADAVIRELGLKLEDEYDPYNPFPPPYRIRYVTDWTADD